VLLEVCCGSVEEAVAAAEAGADRLELCAALPTGGVTPSIGMIEEVRARVSLPLVAMVRPREGGPCPHEADFRAAVRDVRHCVAAGADEIICGVLDAESRVDLARNAELVAAAEGTPVAFHRVFDMAADLDEALASLIGLGFCRVLTSGGAPNVDFGFEALVHLLERAAGRIAILPGGGVREHNARLLMQAGFEEIHFSFRRERGTGYGGVADTEPDPDRIRRIRAVVE
jgi:copper homeostasis protein